VHLVGFTIEKRKKEKKRMEMYGRHLPILKY
jgi:hypothetical protein